VRRFLLGFLACWLVLSADSEARAEWMILKDGSILRGRLVSLSADTLVFRTDFGGTVRIPKDRILRIDFAERPAEAAGGFREAAPGSLVVRFKKVKLASRVRIHRGKERDRALRANAVILRIAVDGRVCWTEVDSTMDKEIREGPDRILRNDFHPERVGLELPAGVHEVELWIASRGGKSDPDRFEGDPLDLRLRKESLRIPPAGKKVVTVGMRKSKWGLGRASLYWVEEP
jgi:hypothetical protein